MRSYAGYNYALRAQCYYSQVQWIKIRPCERRRRHFIFILKTVFIKLVTLLQSTDLHYLWCIERRSKLNRSIQQGVQRSYVHFGVCRKVHSIYQFGELVCRRVVPKAVEHCTFINYNYQAWMLAHSGMPSNLFSVLIYRTFCTNFKYFCKLFFVYIYIVNMLCLKFGIGNIVNRYIWSSPISALNFLYCDAAYCEQAMASLCSRFTTSRHVYNFLC